MGGQAMKKKITELIACLSLFGTMFLVYLTACAWSQDLITTRQLFFIAALEVIALAVETQIINAHWDGGEWK